MKEKKNNTLEEQLALPTDRLALYELVWAKSAEGIIQEYNISAEQLAKICRSLSVPRPMAGYWKALEKGAAPEKPALTPQGNPPVNVKEHIVGALPYAPNNVGNNTTASKRQKKRLPNASATEQQSRLIKEAKIYFPLGRISDTGYLKPNKKKLLDLIVSDSGLEKVLSFADTLFTELKKHGYSVDFDTSKQFSGRPEIDEREDENKNGYHWNRQWKPYFSTLVSIDDIFIGITIIEMSEKVAAKSIKGRYVRDEKNIKLMAAIGKDHFNPRWISTNDLPCGRLRLLAYSSYSSTEWTMSWNETKKQELSSRITSIIRSLKSAVPELEKQLREAELERQKRHAERLIQQEEWRKEEIIRKANEAAKKSKEEFFSIMAQWV